MHYFFTGYNFLNLSGLRPGLNVGWLVLRSETTSQSSTCLYPSSGISMVSLGLRHAHEDVGMAPNNTNSYTINLD